MIDWQAVTLTLKLALVSTLLLLVIGIPLAWWLSQTRSVWKNTIDTIITLPLILPPTVLGYYLLVAFSPEAFAGEIWMTLFGSSLVFSFSGLVLGSMLYSLPFVVQPIRDGFKSIDASLLNVAQTMGANRWQRFYLVALPLGRPMLVTGSLLGFAHTIGEFGVVLLIGGNIPGETRVVSIALFDYVESLQMQQANALAGLLLMFSFVVLYAVNHFNKRFTFQHSS
ncbi:molybdate ABC transporter permease subunit [Alteromonas sp. a30]|uniref:molybdate ABC transporter permease subunit n=1 Tax=Alteromonas sp. a30 TaxID=2730917 RepID=UPI0022819DF9|nr:molybdate ABC transporter permease subunit [Alteromonas sp. a30]MCY7296414.1 molybdate ABC transporter permease subunit [Alteromonas sp. a30]